VFKERLVQMVELEHKGQLVVLVQQVHKVDKVQLEHKERLELMVQMEQLVQLAQLVLRVTHLVVVHSPQV
jgi:hypothetical protein